MCYREVGINMIRLLGGIVLIFISVTCFADDYYFSCAGITGIADYQSAMPLLRKEITSNETRVDGSMQITADKVIVDGIPFVASTYEICQNNDQMLWFSPSVSKDFVGMDPCPSNDEVNDLGVFNKVSGKLKYHVGDFLAVLQCKKVNKLMK